METNNNKITNHFEYPTVFEYNGEKYELTSVLIHKGNATKGHYMLYQRPSIYPNGFY